MSELKIFVVITDNVDAYIVKDLSASKAMRRILTQTIVASRIKTMTLDEAMRSTTFNILQIHNGEVSNLVL